MTPYYQDDHCTIYHGDCLEVLPEITGVDLVFTSPPYNKGSDGTSKGKEWSRLANGYGVHDDNMSDAEYVAWQQQVVTLCMGTLTDTGALFYQHKPIAKGERFINPMRLIPDQFAIRQIVTWVRAGGFQRDGYHLCPEYEWVLVVPQDGWRVADRSVGDCWNVAPSIDAQHPASFPIQLPKIAIRASDPGTILDPFMGSGTTLRAAKDLGRKAIGIEIEEKYCEIAAKRLGQEVLPL